jgi:hypothetical protein
MNPEPSLETDLRKLRAARLRTWGIYGLGVLVLLCTCPLSFQLVTPWKFVLMPGLPSLLFLIGSFQADGLLCPRCDLLAASFPVSLYTATKAIEGCLHAELITGYRAEIHAGVAICLAAAAFADGWQGRAAQERQRAFWIAWFTHIIPTAWYRLADDRLDGLPISVPTPDTPF